MLKKTVKIDLTKLASDRTQQVERMIQELESKARNSPAIPRWGIRFVAAGIKKSSSRP
jgi:hypothetical protein